MPAATAIVVPQVFIDTDEPAPDKGYKMLCHEVP